MRWEASRHRERVHEVLTYLEHAMAAIDGMAAEESSEVRARDNVSLHCLTSGAYELWT